MLPCADRDPVANESVYLPSNSQWEGNFHHESPFWGDHFRFQCTCHLDLQHCVFTSTRDISCLVSSPSPPTLIFPHSGVFPKSLVLFGHHRPQLQPVPYLKLTSLTKAPLLHCHDQALTSSEPVIATDRYSNLSNTSLLPYTSSPVSSAFQPLAPTSAWS